ncbi:energy transducer TonB [Massilia norwichensis]|uniref:Energy transducer TonB n=1 Tax=Massilia norwichensis TaxID=1442366 RepID=A0ABT2AAE1_9BURK|nr:energy transducer TonB [Massilia norwichensis]MCS0591103.1 energy transducer TonB [Massilia norwichensis]
MLIAGLHVVLGTLLVQGLGTRHLSLTSPPDDLTVTLEPTRPEPPPTPVDPPKPMQQLAPPAIVVPKVEVDVAPPLEAPPLVTTTRTEPTPPPAATSGVAPEVAPAAKPATNTGQMHSAVLADANSCALPAYPASAARNGETGTTTLALLVGTDGRVSSARVLQGSGSRTLDRAALSALSLCKFKPAMNNGVPEAGWAQMAYVWTLD